MEVISEMEMNRSACDTYGRMVLAHGDLVKQDDLLSKVRALTLEDVKRAAKKVLTSNPTVAMVVPEGTDRKLLPDHDDVIAIRDDKEGNGPSCDSQPDCLRPG